MSHQSGHIIVRRLAASATTEDGHEPEGKVKVWHLIAGAFVVGLILGLAL